MKSSRQHKRKVSEVPQQRNKCIGSVIKKPINKAAGQFRKAVVEGKDSFVDGQLSVGKLPKRGISFPQTTKFLQSDKQTGQCNHSAKIKLQLFPIDESMRLGMEKDGHNPFLELTLSVRKKISSVIKHLKMKWGCSSVAKGELMLFPFNARFENLALYDRWTWINSDITAGEVHVAVGSPAVFRLRYGWVSNAELHCFGIPNQSSTSGTCLESQSNRKGCVAFPETRYGQMEELGARHGESPKLININESANAAVDDQFDATAADHEGGDAKTEDVPVQKLVSWDDLTNLSMGGLPSELSLQAKISVPHKNSEIDPGLISEISRDGKTILKSKTKDSDQCVQKNTGEAGLQPIQLEPEISVGGLPSEASLQGKNKNWDLTFNKEKLALQANMEKSDPQSHFPWDENLTTLSIGGLLSEASLQGKIKSSDPRLSGSRFNSQEAISISDSFDAFILAQLNPNPPVSKPLLNDSHSSILDAEETCHAFAFEKFSSASKDLSTSSGEPSSNACNNFSTTKASSFPKTFEQNVESLAEHHHFRQHKDISLTRPKGPYDEDSSLGLSSIKWNDSLGPFDLGLPTSRPVLNSGDSISISEFVR